MKTASFNEMVWPVPDEEMGEIVWRFAHGHALLKDHQSAASIIAAYTELVRCTKTKRDMVIKNIRKEII